MTGSSLTLIAFVLMFVANAASVVLGLMTQQRMRDVVRNWKLSIDRMTVTVSTLEFIHAISPPVDLGRQKQLSEAWREQSAREPRAGDRLNHEMQPYVFDGVYWSRGVW